MNIDSPAEKLTSPALTAIDAGEPSIRPQKLDEFTGQKQAIANLKVFISSAKKRNKPLDHIIFHGPPGLGKTTLAQIISHEMGVSFRSTSGPVLTKAGDLAAILTSLQPGDILFIDEIHRLQATVEEMLYPAMEDYKLDIIIGEGVSARTIRIDLPHFTLIGATTRMGLISNPLRDRFGIPVRLNFYDVPDLQIVIERAAKIIGTSISKDGSFEIARRSRGTPRIAVRLLKRVADFASHENAKSIEVKLADKSLRQLEVDDMGLDASDRRYMQYIAENYSGGPVGLETIAAGLSEQRDVIEETIEPYLLQIGFVNRTPRGRMLTQKAFKHLGMEPPKQLTEQITLLDSDPLV